MANPKKIENKKVCPKGHLFYKSSDCLVCPVCEQQRTPSNGWMATLSVPARRALENNGITTIEQLAKYSEKEMLHLHGMGQSSLPKLQQALKMAGLSFKNKGKE